MSTKRDEVLKLVMPQGHDGFEGEYVDHASYDNAAKLEDIAALDRRIRDVCAGHITQIHKRLEKAKDMKEANL